MEHDASMLYSVLQSHIVHRLCSLYYHYVAEAKFTAKALDISRSSVCLRPYRSIGEKLRPRHTHVTLFNQAWTKGKGKGKGI